jgi:hypothetical protein
MIKTKAVGKIKTTHFMVNDFFGKSWRSYDVKKNLVQANWQQMATQYSPCAWHAG